jgi:hypothetical protein
MSLSSISNCVSGKCYDRCSTGKGQVVCVGKSNFLFALQQQFLGNITNVVLFLFHLFAVIRIIVLLFFDDLLSSD